MNRWKLTDLAKHSLQSLADAGVSVSPQDVLDIQAHSIEAIEPPSASVSFARGTPVRIGDSDVFIWPLTFLAADFISRVAPCFRRASSLSIVIAYACHFGHSPEAFADVDKPRMMKRRIQRWADGLPATIAEVAEAVDKLMSHDAPVDASVPEPDIDDDGSSFADLSAEVVSATGQPPDVIEHLMCIDYAIDIVRRIRLAQIASIGGKIDDDSRSAGLGKLARTLASIKARDVESD